MTDDDTPTDVGPDSVTLEHSDAPDLAIVRTIDDDIAIADEHNDVLVPGDSIGDLVDVLEFFDGLREPAIMPVGGPADNTTGDAEPIYGDPGSRFPTGFKGTDDDPDGDAVECPECGGQVRDSLGGQACAECGWEE